MRHTSGLSWSSISAECRTVARGNAMLTDPEMIDARRFMGYPALGTAQSFQVATSVDYRLANLSAAEETVLRQYLTTLAGLEQSIPDAAVGLDTRSAGEMGWDPTGLASQPR